MTTYFDHQIQTYIFNTYRDDVAMSIKTDSSQRRRPRIKRERVYVGGNTNLYVYYIYPRTDQVKGVLFIPPLIGGSYLEQYQQYFYHLSEWGYIIASFNYRGHKRSPGKFSLLSAMKDSFSIVHAIKNRFPDKTLYGIGTCAGSLSLFYCLTHNHNLFDKIALVNAISNKYQVIDYLQVAKMMVSRAFRGRGPYLHRVFSGITQAMFPNIEQTEHRFGLLEFHRTRFFSLFAQFFFINPAEKLNSIDVPTLCCYGTEDTLLGLNTQSNRAQYEQEMHRYFHQLEIRAIKADHYFTDQVYSMNKTIDHFFSL